MGNFLPGVFDINVKSIYHSVNAIIPHMIKQGSGSIINIGSCITSKPTVGLLYYSATKGAVDLITRGLAAEYSSQGIRINGISPSLGQTALVSAFVGEDFTSDMAKDQAKEMPLQRMVTPRDIAKGCLYYAAPFFNDFQTYVHSVAKEIQLLIRLLSGGILRVDGGQYVSLQCPCQTTSNTKLTCTTVLNQSIITKHISIYKFSIKLLLAPPQGLVFVIENWHDPNTSPRSIGCLCERHS
jgi:hypothetical protein